MSVNYCKCEHIDEAGTMPGEPCPIHPERRWSKDLLARARRNADEVREVVRMHRIIHPTAELVEFLDLVVKELEERSAFEHGSLVTDGSVIGVFIDQAVADRRGLYARPDNSVIARHGPRGMTLVERETRTLRKPTWEEMMSACVHGSVHPLDCPMDGCSGRAQTLELRP